MDIQKIGKFLAQLRREQEMTQEQLGEKLGVTNKTVSRWENGNYLPPVEMLQALSEFYGLTINELLSARRLTADEYQHKAEENLKAMVEDSSFTLDEKVQYFERKWKKDHFSFRLLARILLWGLLVVGIFKQEILWSAIYAIGSIVYFGVERNKMMKYVEERAFDGTGLH